MSKTRSVIATAALCAALLAGCGSADDLKARWVTLPSPATTEDHGEDIPRELLDTTVFLGPLYAPLPLLGSMSEEDMRIFSPAEGYSLVFRDGVANLDLPSGSTLTVSFTEDDMYVSDANGDGRGDVLIRLDIDSGSESAVGVLTGLAAGEGMDWAFHGPERDITTISAIEGGWSYTTTNETLQVGYPSGSPVIIDEHGGAIGCPRDMAVIEQALASEPAKAEELLDHESGSAIAGFPEDGTYFELAGTTPDSKGMVVFLLDGGDMTLASDYRCGWEQ